MLRSQLTELQTAVDVSPIHKHKSAEAERHLKRKYGTYCRRSAWRCLGSHQPTDRAASRQSAAAPWSPTLGM